MNANGASDPETGIAGYSFVTPFSGFLSATQTGNKVDVTFDGSSNGSGAQSVSRDQRCGRRLRACHAFTVTPDSGAPTGGLLSIIPYSGSLTVSHREDRLHRRDLRHRDERRHPL